MNSCLYVGSVSHQRHIPRRHRFSYRLCLAYLDLGEVDELLASTPGCSGRWPAPFRFRRRDHIGDPQQPLIESVRELISSQTGAVSDGPVRLLTGLGFFWQRFNPVSFYYCFDQSAQKLEFVVAEVTNTPWGEQYCYVLDARDQVATSNSDSGLLRFSTEKSFHVSPFLPMDLIYHWRLRSPGEKLLLDITETRAGELVFNAGLALKRQPFTVGALVRNFLRVPAITLKVVAAIYWEALRLWLKSVPFFPHPASHSGGAK